MEICGDTTTRDRPVEDIGSIDTFFSLGELFFIDKILTNTSTLDDLSVGFFGFVATMLGKEEIKRLTIAVARLLPESPDLSLGGLLGCDIRYIESLLSLGDIEEMSPLCLLSCKGRTLTLEL